MRKQLTDSVKSVHSADEVFKQILSVLRSCSRMKGRPFAMLGVDTDSDTATARKVMEAEGVPWPNRHDGEPGEGPIAKLYHVGGYPTIYVIDALGKIRSKRTFGIALDQLVDKLVAQQEAADK